MEERILKYTVTVKRKQTGSINALQHQEASFTFMWQ